MAKLTVRKKQVGIFLGSLVGTILTFSLLPKTFPLVLPSLTRGFAVTLSSLAVGVDSQLAEVPEQFLEPEDTNPVPLQRPHHISDLKRHKVREALSPIRKPIRRPHSPEKSGLPLPSKIIITTTVCAKFGDGGPLHKASVMVKSVIIAARLHKIPKVDIYLLLEYREDEYMFHQKFQELGFENGTSGIQIYFRYIQDAFPNELQKQIQHHKRQQCFFGKIFLPTTLEHLDSVIYLDTDTIVTGNPVDLWHHFYRMNGSQAIGAVRDSEPNNPFGIVEYTKRFGEIPHPEPKGLNTGVLLMNLTRLRSNDWENKLLRVYKDYKRILKKKPNGTVVMDDEKVINILLYYSSHLLYILPCHFNLKGSDCGHGFYCEAVAKDTVGVQVVHGVGDQFELGGTFHRLFEVYEKVDLKKRNLNLGEDLIIPIRNLYAESVINPRRGKMRGEKERARIKCYKIMSSFFFRNFLS